MRLIDADELENALKILTEKHWDSTIDDYDWENIDECIDSVYNTINEQPTVCDKRQLASC